MSLEATMARPKRLLTIAATFSFALGIGFVMQYGDAVAARFLPSETPDAPLTPQEAEEIADLGLNGSSITPFNDGQTVETIIGTPSVGLPLAPLEDPVLMAAVEEDDESNIMTDAVPAESAPSCEITMSAAAMPHALVDLTVQTECFANESFVIPHQGMMFTANTGTVGLYNAVVPALAEEAFFIAAFDNGEGAIAQAVVADIANYDRAVLQWQGDQGIHMHAREFGAYYGDTGHLSLADVSVGDMALLEEGKGGYIHAFGSDFVENSLMAEVYTFPSMQASADAEIILTAEVEVTDENCGREVIAQSLQITPYADTTAADLVMIMPDCDAIGEFLVLKNMFQDLTLASR
jgi:hypothetical protein